MSLVLLGAGMIPAAASMQKACQPRKPQFSWTLADGAPPTAGFAG